ncbi:MAG: anti-sigma factor antagonist [Bacteroidetes bacterium]|nr:MAG: anti-sigma factor antagonist [Bacteroidota bacterium]
MKYTIDKHEKYSIISLEDSKLDSSIAPNVKSEFITLFQSGTKNLILDLTKVKYVDSSGLSSILVANRLSSEVKGYLVLVGTTDHVLKLITISKLDSVLNLIPTIEEAIDAIFLAELEKDLHSGTE